MSLPSVLFALHQKGSDTDAARALADEGFPVSITRNMAVTWARARKDRPDAIILDPASDDPHSAEFRSLLALAAVPDGPALLILVDHPSPLDGSLDAFDDDLPHDIQVDRLMRRVRFCVARRSSLRQLHQEREDLLEQTITDFKTGLYNARYFEERKEEEVSRAKRQGIALGILMIDLDKFKNINDEHDHHFGDYVLRRFSETLCAHLRNFDLPSRFGGDEFAVLLPNADLEQAMVIAERLRTAVAQMVLENDGKRVGLTVSIGVSSWHPDDDQDFEWRLLGADQALLRAKKTGRNQVHSFDPERNDEPEAAR